MAKATGGPAFPGMPITGGGAGKYNGMTLRDYFAGQALAGLLACYSKVDNQTFPYSDEVAERAYETADAMLAERDK